ncbi:hypothetical protein SBY92_002642 [Candida maltosa Xu316]
MFQRSIRRVSSTSKSKSIPYQPIPRNKFNQTTSAYNLKPVPTEGLVYNPPAAIIKPYMQTPYIFLPENDPRRPLAKQQRIKPEIVNEMPIIRKYNGPNEREYNVTAETILKIKELRSKDPQRWTLKEISKEFNIELVKLHYFFRSEKEKKVEQNTGIISKKLLDREKRRQLWLRNEF